jgi:hypothetical protein
MGNSSVGWWECHSANGGAIEAVWLFADHPIFDAGLSRPNNGASDTEEEN